MKRGEIRTRLSIRPIKQPSRQIQASKRQTVLPKKSVQQPGIPWHSWALLVVVVVAGAALFYFTYGLVLRGWVRWTVTGLWVVLTVAMGYYDFVGHEPGSGQGTDATVFDRWSVSHFGAGLAFGVWFLPLWVVVILTVAWEIFEIKVVGFGDHEIFWNHMSDIGVALLGWVLIVAVGNGALIEHPAFPLWSSVGR